MKKRILCALLLGALLMALSVPAFADAPLQVQTVSLGIPCTVTVDVGKYGRVSVGGTAYTGADVGTFKVDPGTLVTFEITPNSGYRVSVLTLSGTDVLSQMSGRQYSVTVEHDETLVVRFVRGVLPSPTPTPKPGSTPKGPKTGDESAVSLWSALLAASALGCAAAATVWKKKDKK